MKVLINGAGIAGATIDRWRIAVRNGPVRAAVPPGAGRLLGGVMIRGAQDLIVDETEGGCAR